jgi:hypothetical protein
MAQVNAFQVETAAFERAKQRLNAPAQPVIGQQIGAAGAALVGGHDDHQFVAEVRVTLGPFGRLG